MQRPILPDDPTTWTDAQAQDFVQYLHSLTGRSGTPAAPKPVEPEAIERARAEIRGEAMEIVELCRVAGDLASAAEFIEKGTPTAQVKQALIGRSWRKVLGRFEGK